MSREIDDLLAALRESAWGKKTEALRTLTAKLAAGEISEQQEEAMVPSIAAAARDSKWEVQKAAAVALSELRYADVGLVQSTLEGLALDQQSHYVKEAADRALKRIRSRTQRQKEWKLTEDARDPTLQHIMMRIREIGLRSMTPARIYDLAMEVSEQSYREVAADTAHEMRNIVAPFEGYLIDLGEQLSDDDADRENERELVGLALSRLEHINRLIDDLGVYSAPTAADFSPTNLESIVREAIAVGADRGEMTVGEGVVRQVIDVPHVIVIDALAELRNRRNHEIRHIKARLLALDYLLAHSENEYFETAKAKRRYLVETLKVPDDIFGPEVDGTEPSPSPTDVREGKIHGLVGASVFVLKPRGP